MLTHKEYWRDEFEKNSEAWYAISVKPLFDAEGKWIYGGPGKIETQLRYAVTLAMGDAPDDLVKAMHGRAQKVIDEIERIDLLNTDQRHARLHSSKISYLRGKLLLNILKGGSVAPELWRELGVLKIELFDGLRREGTSAPDEKFRAILYFLLAGDYHKAGKTLNSIRAPGGYDDEYGVMKDLVPEMAGNGKVRDGRVRSRVIDYFERMRGPGEVAYKKFSKNPLDKFEWALLLGAIVEPGDGRLDARRALDMMGR